MIPTVLTIAGSDPSGGAGIQADLKTFSTIGVYGAAAITCLTVQNSKGVQEITFIPPSLVQKQVEAVLNDHQVTHIKIGMIGQMEISKTISTLLKSFAGESIYDPVITATTGQDLLEKTKLDELNTYLINSVTVLTPNIIELEQLSGRKIETEQDVFEIGRNFLQSKEKMRVLLVKGSHLEEEETTLSDYMFTRDGAIKKDTRKRHPSVHLHGTGCTYASAFTAYHTQTNDDLLSFQKTGRYMSRLIEQSMRYLVVKNDSNGPLIHHLVRKEEDIF